MNFLQPEANWWLFSVSGESRGERIKDNPAAGTVEVNPEVDGKRLLSYHRYLRLDRLLGSQFPSSRAPDERIFIITHQLFELVFKQTIFDLRVIAETFRSLLELDRKNFSGLCEISGRAGNSRVEDFWRPASTAASRVRHSWQRVIPAIMAYLATEDNFNNREFTGNFRDNLSPASGFQSAQFRLIQRGLGKSYLLEIRLFPADAYLENYLGLTGAEIRRVELEAEHAGLLSVIDRLILQEDAPLASPAPDSPLFPVSVLDDLAHKVLGKIAISATPGPSAEEAARDLPRLPQDESSIESLVAAFKEGLTTVLAKIKQKKSLPPALSVDERRLIEKRGAVFRKEWAVAVARENQRRGTFETACLGAGLLLQNGHGGYLRKILDSLNEADEALSGRFLLFHQHLVARRLGEVPGTAGGGAPFLEFFRTLAQRFPALIALRAAREKL